MTIFKLSIACVLMTGAAACTGDQGEMGDTGATGATGAGVVAETTDEAPGANCANGGIKFSWGVDDNGNGALDADEVDGSKYICNGSDGGSGHDTLVTTTSEPAGANCAAGGLKVEHGLDDNDNGTLDASEVDATDYVCAPTQSLIATATEPPGANCPDGGTAITSGLDDNANGVLDAGEVDSTEYACNGSGGQTSLVSTSTEPVGANCVVGGTRVDYGVDDNGNSVLDGGEIDGTAYVCDPGQLFDSIPNGQTSASPRPAEDACGVQLTVGSADVVVRNIGALTNQSAAGNVKYVVMDHGSADAVLYTSSAKATAGDTTFSWKYSDPVGITLAAGKTYCIAMITDVSASYAYDIASNSAAGLTTTAVNPNVQNFATPVVYGHANADCGIRIVTY